MSFETMSNKSDSSSSPWEVDTMRQALQAVDKGMPIKVSAEKFGIPHKTLTNYVTNELRLDDLFMENFDPEKSKREQRKLNRKIYHVSKRYSANFLYDSKGFLARDGTDICDCLIKGCEGCFYPCPLCESSKCGHECRQNRRWMYESHEIQGTGVVKSNRYNDQ